MIIDEKKLESHEIHLSFEVMSYKLLSRDFCDISVVCRHVRAKYMQRQLLK